MVTGSVGSDPLILNPSATWVEQLGSRSGRLKYG